MSENYIVINGRRTELTEEQLKQLGERVKDCGLYCFINCYGDIKEDSREDDAFFNNVNHFNDKQFAKQLALHQLLYRKLLEFSYDNGYEDTAEWDGGNEHWAIRYNSYRNEFRLYYQDGYKAHEVYFSSEEGAKRAIKEVVEPFMKEHPEFVW